MKMERYSRNILFLVPKANRNTCLFCQLRQFQTAARLARPVESKFNKRSEEFQHSRYLQGELVPKPLSRPLGLSNPPEPGQNSGQDDRSFRQKWNDYYSYEKHVQRRQDLIDDVIKKNYWRDVGNLGKIHKGKSIIAPKTPYRAEVALYFPNLQGTTLASPKTATDTTYVLKDRITIINVMSSKWAEEQCKTFTGKEANPELYEYLKEVAAVDAKSALQKDKQPAKVQQAYINVEPNRLKAWIVKMIFGRLRQEFPTEEHPLYFLVNTGFSDEIRDALGMWNSKVGYVYLLDGQCKVRWAGNGNATAEERQSLINCIKRLRKNDDPYKPFSSTKRASGQEQASTKQSDAEKVSKNVNRPKQGMVAE